MLNNHPFAVDAFFERSVVLTYAYPAANLRSLLPVMLELDTLDETTAFVAAALVRTRSLRPKGFPKMFGNDFFLIGYRAFVKFINSAGKRRRGLYILGSRTDSPRLKFFGNIFTQYDYSLIDVEETHSGLQTRVFSRAEGLDVSYQIADDEVELPNGSPFTTWKEARRYAGPLPFTFTCEPNSKKVLVIEGVRENWQPKPVKVIEHRVEFFDKLAVGEGVLANAFAVENIPYRWEKGRIETAA